MRDFNTLSQLKKAAEKMQDEGHGFSRAAKILRAVRL
jgi:hypothetical protein